VIVQDLFAVDDTKIITRHDETSSEDDKRGWLGERARDGSRWIDYNS
jgi:hypothetical protein